MDRSHSNCGCTSESSRSKGLRDGDGNTRAALFEGYWPASMAKAPPLAPFALEFVTDVCPCDDDTSRQRYAIDVMAAGNTTRVFDGGVGYINAPEPFKIYVPTAGGPASCGSLSEDWAIVTIVRSR